MFEDIKKLFIEQHGLYSKMLKFRVLLLITMVIIFFNVYFKNNYGFVIILLVFAIYIGNMYVNTEEMFVSDNNHLTLVKLQKLQDKINKYVLSKERLLRNTNVNKSNIMINNNELDSLYIDSNMINFLHSVIKLSDYNENEFYLLLKGTNNILRIKKEIEIFYDANGVYPENTSELLESALELKTNTINNMHNFIYKVPKMNIMYKYVNDSINRYSVLISRVTDSIHDNYKNNIKKRGINAHTRYVSYDVAKGYDDGDVGDNKLNKFYM